MAARQTVKQKIYLDGGGLIMASIEGLLQDKEDVSKKISELSNLNLETGSGEAARERTLGLLRARQVGLEDDLRVAREKEEIQQVQGAACTRYV